MSLWEVARVEGVPFDAKYSDLLQSLVAEDEARPHSNAALAAKGWQEYYHMKVVPPPPFSHSPPPPCCSLAFSLPFRIPTAPKAGNEVEKLSHEEATEAMARKKDVSKEDFEAAREALAIAGGDQKAESRRGRCEEPRKQHALRQVGGEGG